MAIGDDPTMASPSGLGLADVELLRWAMEPALDPAGRRLAYVAAGLDAAVDGLDYRIHVLEIDPHATAPPRVVPRRARSPRWSATGQLAMRVADDESIARWRLAVEAGEGRPEVADGLPGDVSDMSWSPVGDRIAVAVGGPDGGAGLWIVDVDAGAMRRVPGTERGTTPRWSPDGGHIAFVVDSVVRVVEVSTGAVAVVATSLIPVRSLAWSPDSGELALLGSASSASPWANVELLVVDAGGGGLRRLAPSLDRSIGQVVRGDDERGITPPQLAWSSDGAAIFAAYADGGTSGLAAFGVDGTITPISTGHRTVLEFDAAAGVVAYTWSDPMTPGEVSIVDAGGVERQCSFESERLRSRVLVETRRVATEFAEGWLTVPAGHGDQPVPLVVQVHGGPHHPVGERFSFDAQRLASAGYAVLRGNPRGSQGYGIEFASAVVGDWGGGDATDVLDLVSAACAAFPIDPRRVAVIGESYGGYLALWLAATTDRFAAAVAENGVADLALALEHNRRFWAAELDADGTDAPLVVERSPITHSRRLTTPLLLVHAVGDDVSPIEQSLRMREAVAPVQPAVVLYEVHGEGHMVNVTGRLSSRRAKLATIDAFLAEHLAATDVSSFAAEEARS